MRAKRFLAAAAAFVMCAAGVMVQAPGRQDGMVTAVAMDYTWGTENGLNYYKYIDHVVITGHDSTIPAVLEIPAEIEVLPVTTIGEWALWSCTDLTGVIIPDSVTTIESFSFYGCPNLTSVTIPDSITSFGTNAFESTAWLTALQEEDPIMIVNGILINARSVEGDFVIPDSIHCIANGAFMENRALTSVTIPETVTNIGGSMFSGCTALTEITLPDSVTSIGWSAFSRCTALTSVTIPDTVTSIGGSAFSECTALTEITLPDSVTSIGSMAFYNCTSLETVTFPNNAENVGSYAFSETPWYTALLATEEPFVILNGVLFDEKNAEGDVTIPDDVRCVADSAFVQNFAITSVIVPAGVKQIGQNAFGWCKKMETITILNPDCVIYDDKGTIYNDHGEPDDIFDSDKPVAVATTYEFHGTIYGYPGSTAEAYATKYNRNFTALDGAPEVPAEPVLGDPSGDEQINASDAAIVLMAAATEGTTGVSTLTPAQKKAADVNKDTEVNASDAAIILMYSASVGTGYDGTIEEFQKR